MKMYREELRQVSILLNLTIIIGLYYIFGVLFVGFTQFKFSVSSTSSLSRSYYC